MWASIAADGFWQGEVWNRRRSGEVYPEWLTVSRVMNESGEIQNFVGVFSDITQLKHSEARLHHLAHYDALTGLPNRVLLLNRLGMRSPLPIATSTVWRCCFLDIRTASRTSMTASAIRPAIPCW